MLSAVTAADVAELLKSWTVNQSGDIVVPIHAQVGSTALETILGVEETLNSVQEAINAYLNAVPGWHITGGVDTSPSYAGLIDGSIVLTSLGTLKSVDLKMTGSADIGGCVEGYYGVSVLHVGVGAAADLSANINATASYSVDTNTWYFGGSASLDGYVKGYGAATAWPFKGEIYIKGELEAAAAFDTNTGLATASIDVTGSVGASAQMKSLFGGWTTIASTSKTLGSWRQSVSYDVGGWLQDQVDGVATTVKTTAANSLATSVTASAATPLSTSPTTVSDAMTAELTAKVAAQPSTAMPTIGANLPMTVAGISTSDLPTTSLPMSIHAAALQQVLDSGMLLTGLSA